MSKILGIDYGSKRVGIALSDEGGTIAFPKTILLNDRHLVQTLSKFCIDESVREIVVGESRDGLGEQNPIMEAILEFKQTLEKEIRLPVHLEQEFMTSVNARNFKADMLDDGRRHSEKKESIDASAAALILQRYLDRKKNAL
ncbi:MAG: Holliday junction resolvase RuvX [Candidatus Paceibacterota bacterium]|jgi:putative Holliday junction resolvase